MAKKRLTQAEKSAITRQRIYDCAIELFEKNGFENVTMQDIAGYSNTSIGSIYHFFKDKDSIALHMMTSIDSQYEEYLSYLEETAREKGLSAFEQLKMFCVKIQVICLSRGDTSLSLMYANGLRHLDEDNLRMDKRKIYQILEYFINKCKEEGSIAESFDNEDIKRRIIILSRGLMLDWMLSGHAFELVSESEYMMMLLLNSLAPSAEG